MAKNVVIMGATSGIGEELARRFAALGCDLAIAGRREDRLRQISEKLQAETGAKVIWEKIDVRSDEAPLGLSHLVRELGGVDLYIHASGVGSENPDLTPEIELNTLATNADGFVRCIDAVFTIMRSQPYGAQIAAISSVASTRGLGIAPAYSATKALQKNYLEALRQRSAARGLDIYVTDIRPGFIDTPLIAGHRYPLTMPLPYAADRIVKAILAKKRVAWIDWRYMLLSWAWAALPGVLWENLPIGFYPFLTPSGGKAPGRSGRFSFGARRRGRAAQPDDSGAAAAKPGSAQQPERGNGPAGQGTGSGSEASK